MTEPAKKKDAASSFVANRAAGDDLPPKDKNPHAAFVANLVRMAARGAPRDDEERAVSFFGKRPDEEPAVSFSAQRAPAAHVPLPDPPAPGTPTGAWAYPGMTQWDEDAGAYVPVFNTHDGKPIVPYEKADTSEYWDDPPAPRDPVSFVRHNAQEERAYAPLPPPPPPPPDLAPPGQLVMGSLAGLRRKEAF